MSKHDLGFRELADVLQASPPRGRTFPDQPYSLRLYFNSVAAWEAAVEQYDAQAYQENDDGDGHYAAVRKFAEIDPKPYAFAGAELYIVHVAEATK